MALTVNSCDQPVLGFEMVPLQSRFALMSTWLMTQPPKEWSLKPLCINESQNSLPCVEVFCAQVVGRLRLKMRVMIKYLRCFILVWCENKFVETRRSVSPQKDSIFV